MDCGCLGDRRTGAGGLCAHVQAEEWAGEEKTKQKILEELEHSATTALGQLGADCTSGSGCANGRRKPSPSKVTV